MSYLGCFIYAAFAALFLSTIAGGLNSFPFYIDFIVTFGLFFVLFCIISALLD